MSCNAGIPIAQTVHTSVEVRKRVTNPIHFWEARVTIQKKIWWQKGVFTWIYIGGWVADEGRVWIHGGRKEVAGTPAIPGFSSKGNSVTGKKEWGRLFCLRSAWGIPGINPPHLSTGQLLLKNSLETVKGDQMFCLSYRLCSGSEKEQEKKPRRRFLCTCFIEGVLSGKGESGKQARARGKDLSLSVVSARHSLSTHLTQEQELHQSWSHLEARGPAFCITESVSSSLWGCPWGREPNLLG